jgi:hypothetical protein
MIDRTIWRIGADGIVYLVDETGERRRIAEQGKTPPVPPDWLVNVLFVRRMIPDPYVTDFLLVEELPATGITGCGYVLFGDSYDGMVWLWQNGVWAKAKLQIGTAYLNDLIHESGKYNAAIAGIDAVIATIDPLTWAGSYNVGAENTSLANLAELTAWFNARKSAIMAQMQTIEHRTPSMRWRGDPVKVGWFVE